MDVSCTRCGTEYEFDDALISERGTNVRCTQCGYQFKVFPPKLATVGPDEWIVLTGLGRRIVYRSLRELQNGIVKGDVAREDLLARGSKPPRPLGSIAELDPLFVVKSAPERQPSTLTGVAPPRLSSAASARPSNEEATFDAPGEPQTFSGVAPPANNVQVASKAPPHASHESTLPLAGRSGTVLGLGGIGFQASKASTAGPDATQSEPPHTRPFAASPDTQPKPPTPTRVSEETAALVEVHGIHAKPPPPVRAKASTDTEAERVPAQAPADVVRDVALAKGSGGPTETQAARAETHLARVQLQQKLVPIDASEASTSKSPDDHAEKRPSTKTSVAPQSEPDVSSTRLAEPSGPATANLSLPTASDAETKVAPKAASEVAPKATSEVAPKAASATSEVAPKATSEVASDATPEPQSSAPRQVAAAVALPKQSEQRAPRKEPLKPKGHVHSEQAAPSRPKISAAQASPIPWGRIAITIGVLALSGYAGMRLVGAHLQSQKQRAPQASAAQVRTVPNAWLPNVEASLERGDDAAARAQLSAVAPEERNLPVYRSLNARTTAESCDKIWWRLQLVGKASGDVYAQSKQQLTECLERLNRAVAEAKTGSELPELAFASSIDARRMQGEKSDPTDARVVEQLRQPSSKALRYSSSILSWVKAGVPDDTIVSSLRESRGTPVDVGSRSTALLVALVQLGRFSEARQELKALQGQSASHPLQSELTLYLEHAERAQADAATDAGVDVAAAATSVDAGKAAEPSDPNDPDSDLYAGDFRLRLLRANECLSRNELTRAQKLLRSVLAQRPNDTEAITAVGDVHRRRGDLAQARQMYDKALGVNGNYLPAMSGAAEVRWKSGDRAGAVSLFKRILERVGDTPGYGQSAAARIREAEGAAKEQP